ncbi:MAG: CpaF family protein [Euryarchaeota archaeon]
MAKRRKDDVKDLLGDLGDDLLRDILGGEESEEREERQAAGAEASGASEAEEERKVQPLPSEEAEKVLEKHEEAEEGEGKVLCDDELRRIIEYPDQPVPIYVSKDFNRYYKFEALRSKIVKRLGADAPRYARDDEEFKRVLDDVKDILSMNIDFDPTQYPNLEEREKAFMEEVEEAFDNVLNEYPELEVIKDELKQLLVYEMIGYKHIHPLLKDDNLEEIMVVPEVVLSGQARECFVYVYDRDHGMCLCDFKIPARAARTVIERISRESGRRIDRENPLLDAHLPDGSRVNATIPPVSPDGPTITIRKFREDPLTITDIIRFGTLSYDAAAYLWLAVEHGANILIAGGTGSGKTTTLNCLCIFIPPEERIITIEDTLELQLPHEHWVRLTTKPPNVEGKGEITMDDLVKNTLRQRPDRIIVGEVRGPEARTLFTAMNTGHDGCMGTLHANTARETITRLTNEPMNVPKIMIPALDIIVMQNRFLQRGSGSIRRVTEISEIAGMEGDTVQLNTVFEWKPETDEVRSTEVPSMVFKKIQEKTGMSMDEILQEVEIRKQILKYLVDNNIRHVKEVGRFIQEFYKDREKILQKVGITGFT